MDYAHSDSVQSMAALLREVFAAADEDGSGSFTQLEQAGVYTLSLNFQRRSKQLFMHATQNFPEFVDHVLGCVMYPLMKRGQWAATTEFKINYLAPVKGGELRGESTVVSLTKRTAVAAQLSK